MALLFMDGFDAGDFAQKWDSNSGASSNTSTRFAMGRSIRLQHYTYYVSKFITPSARVYIGFAHNLSAYGNEICRTYSDSGVTTQVVLWLTATGELQIRRGGTQIALSQPWVLTGGWAYVELCAQLDDATGYVEARVNGVTVCSFTGDTRNGGTSTNIDRVLLFGDGYFDDVYIADATGAAPYNNFLGDVRVHTMTPSAAGTTTQFTPSSGANYTTVDELPYSATDYVSSATPTTKDTYQMSDLPSGVNTIYGVQTNVIAKKTDAGTIAIKPVVRSGATDYSGTAVALAAADVTVTNIRSLDPSTSTAWTASGVNNMEAGVEIS